MAEQDPFADLPDVEEASSRSAKQDDPFGDIPKEKGRLARGIDAAMEGADRAIEAGVEGLARGGPLAPIVRAVGTDRILGGVRERRQRKDQAAGRKSGELGDVRAGGIRDMNAASQSKPKQAPAYRNKQEAIDDAVNLIDEGADRAKVAAQFERLGVTAEEIQAEADRRNPAATGPSQPPQDPAAVTNTINQPPQSPIQQGLDLAKTAVGRGIRQAGTALDVMETQLGTRSAESVGRRVAERNRTMPAYAEEVQGGLEAISKSKTMGEAAERALANPAALVAMLTESIIASSPGILAAGVGSLAGPAGTAFGAGAGSLAIEFGSSLVDFMGDKGLDARDPVAIARMLKDEALMAEAREYALRRGIPVAAFDALSGGIAGKFLGPVLQKIESGALKGGAAIRQVAAKSALEAGFQMGAGAAGEAGGQFFAGQDYQPADILLEMFAELPGGAVEVASNVLQQARAGSPGEPGSEIAGGKPADLTGPFSSVSTNFTPVDGGFKAPNGAIITPEQWDNASPRVRAGWMQGGEQAPTVPRETATGIDVGEAEEITAAPAPAGLEPENEMERAAEMRRLADQATDPAVRQALLGEAKALEREMADIDTGTRQASELERLAAASADPAVAEKLQARAAKLRQALAPPTKGIKVEEQSLDDMVGQTPQTPLSAKGIKVEEGAVEEIAVEDVDPFLPSKPERRRNAEQRAKVAEMSPEQMRRELLTSPVTGLGNKRAWQEAPRAPVQTNVDVDSLKWINDTLGHEVGDVLLAKVGAAFSAVGAEAYHLSGDEFRVQAESPEAAAAVMRKVNALLKKEEISATLPDGTVVTKKGIGVSHGHGSTVDEAERALQRHKAERQKKGVRPERGAEPSGVDRRKPGPGSEAGSAGVGQPRGVASRPAKRGAQATPAEPQTLGQSPLLQKIVDTAKGLRKSLLKELNFDARNDRGKSVNWSMGGRGQLFRNEEGLEHGDDIVEWLEQNGYLSQAQIDEAELTKTGGSHELAWEMLRSEISNPGSVVALEKADDKAANEAARRARFDLEREAAELGIDTSLPDDELAEKVQAAFIDKTGLTLPEAYDAELAHQASQLDEDAFERAAMQFPDDDAAFMRAIREILNGNDQATRRRSQDDESAAGAVASRPGASLEGPQDPEAGEGGGEAPGDAQQGTRPEQARPDDEGRVEEPRPGLDGDAAARAPRVKRDGYTTDLFGAPLPSPQGVGVDTGVAAAAGTPADSTAPSTLPKGSTSLVDVVTRRIGRLKLPARKIDSPVAAAQAFAHLRKYPREYLDALIVDADDQPIAHWRGFMGAQSQTSVYPAELAKFAASVPGAAGIWMAHNHPSGLAVPSRADELLTENIVRLMRGSIPLKGHVVIAGQGFAEVNPNGSLQGEIPPTLRTQEVPMLERVVLKTGYGEVVNNPQRAREAAQKHFPTGSGLVFLDTQNRFIASVPYDLTTPRRLRANGEAAKLMAMVGRLDPGAVIFATGQRGVLTNDAIGNIAGLFRGLDVRPLDAISSDGISSAARGPLWYSPLATALEAVKTESAPPAQWIGTIKGLKGVSQSEIEWSGVIEWLGVTPEKKVTRQQVVDFVAENGVKVNENVLSDGTIDREEQTDQQDNLRADFREWFADNFPQSTQREVILTNATVDVWTGPLLNDQQAAWLKDWSALWAATTATSRADRVTVQLTALGYQPEFDNGTGELLLIKRMSDGAEFFFEADANAWHDGGVYTKSGEPQELPENIAALARSLDAETMPAGNYDFERDDEVRYADYTLPGGKNYREILLTLPTTPSKEGLAAREAVFKKWEAKIDEAQRNLDASTRRGGAYSQAKREFENLEAQRDLEADQAYTLPADKSYIGPHWQEPNVLAHVRITERTDADGKRVLFVEEIQSDWAQKGRKKGFAGLEKKKLPNWFLTHERGMTDARFAWTLWRNTPPGSTNRSTHVRWGSGATRAEVLRNARTTAAVHEDDLQNIPTLPLADDEVLRQISTDVIPRAPFVEKTDAWAALALKRAIKYAIDNGFERVAWTTGKQQADRYSLRKHIESLSYLRAGDGTYIIKGLPKGRNSEWHTFARDVPANDVSDYVGKEMADKIIGNPNASGFYHGVDLEVGGEGMLGFYDRILPKLANDVLKKLGGGKVAQIALPLSAVDQVGRVNLDYAPKANQQPGFDITPEMRASAQRGMPLFKREEAPKSKFPQPMGVRPFPQPRAPQTPAELAERKASVRAALVDAFGPELVNGLEQLGILRIETSEENPSRVSLDPEVRAVFSERDYRGPGAAIFYDRIDPRDAPRLLMHEVGEHFGLIRMLGDTGYFRLLKQIAAKHKRGDPEIEAAWAYVKAAYTEPDGTLMFPEGSDPFLREVAAVAVEQAPYRGWVREVLDTVRAWLYRLVGEMPFLGVDSNLLRGLASAALRSAALGQLPRVRTKGAAAAAMDSPRAKLIRQGREYEGRLWGGSYDAAILVRAPRGAIVRKTIAEARTNYNALREQLGLAPVTDWATLPADLVQRLPESAAALVRSPALDRLDESQMEAVDRRLAAMGADGNRLRANLINPDLSGTPWAKQTVDGMLIRAAIDEYVAGREPTFANPLDAPEGENLRERLKRQGANALWAHLGKVGLVGDAAKPVNNVNSSFANCEPSVACATYCYATRGNYPAFNPTVKAEITNWAVETDPRMAASIIENNYKNRAEFHLGKALRLFDKGDGSPAWLPVIKHLNEAGIRTQIFSKRPDFLRQVSAFNVRLLSVDSTNLEVARANPDLPIAFIYTDPSQIDFLNEVKDRVQVILPVKLGSRLMTTEEIKALPAWTKVYQCPLDNGSKKLPSVKGSEGWVCTKCDKNAGIGCFRGQSTASMLKAAAAPPKPGAQLDKAAQEIRDVIERSIPEGQREDANRILDGLMAAIRAGVDISAEGSGTQGDPQQSGIAAVSVVRFFPGERRRSRSEDAEASGPAAQDVTRFEGEGGRTLDDDAAAVVKARGDRLVGVDRKLRAQLKAGEITQDGWRAGRNAAAEQFLDAVSTGFGDSAMAEKVFNRLGLYRGTEGLFYALEQANERIKNAISGGPQVANLEAETRRLADAMMTPEQMADAMTGRSATPVPGEMAIELMRAWSGALGFRVEAPKVQRPLLENDAAARGPRSRPTPTPPVNASNLDEEDAIGIVARKMFDRFNRVRELQRRIPGIPDDKNVVQADTLYYGRAQFLGEELERNYIEPLGEALKAARKLGITVRDADDYLMAKHAPERNRVIAQRNAGFAQGGGSGMTDPQAAAILAGFTPQQTVALEEVGRIVYAMNVDKLQRLATSGVITVQLAQLLTQQYQFYVPLKNIDDEADAHGIGRGYEIRNSGIEMSFGRMSKAGSPIANSMMDAARAIVLSEKARVDQVLWNLAQDPAVGDVLVPMDDALAQTTFNRQRYNPTTRQIETITDGNWKNRDDVVKLRIAGEEQYLWVRDDLLRDQLRKVATLDDPGPVLRALGKVTGTIGRTLTEFNPAFTLPNGVRDSISVFMRSRAIERVSPAAVMAGIPVAWKMIVDFKRDANTPGAQMYREFQEDGGKTGAYGITDAVDTFHHLERLGAELGYADRERGMGTKAWHALGTMAKWISHGNEVIEYATRLSVYREARAQGYSRQQAALWGKEISVNFNRSGEYGRTLNSAFVFANAALQGLYGTIMFGKSHKVRMAMLGLVVLGAAAQAWNEMGGGDDEETGDLNVNTLSEFALDHNATVLAPGSSQGVKIPLPPEYAFLYATGRRLYRAMSQGDIKREAAGIGGAFLGSTLPLRAPDASSIPISSLKAITPTAILPFADIALNENFMGAPIVTEQRNRQAPQPYVVLSRRNTSDLAKATAELVNTATGGDRIEPGLAQQAFGPFVSAEAMEHVVGYYTGGVGQFALQSTNMVKALAGDEEAVDVNKIPIANRFIFKQPQGFVARRYREIAPKFQYAIAREREGTTTDLIEPQVASALPEFRGAERELRLLFADLRRAGEESDKARVKDLENQIRQVQTRVIRAYNDARE